MPFRSTSIAVVALALLALTAGPRDMNCLRSSGTGSPTAAEQADIKVLYAGHVDSARAKDFTSFLGQHFAKVTAIDLGKVRDADARGYDVVLIDWTSIYPRDKDGKISNDNRGLLTIPSIQLSRDFDRPTVLIGAAGGQFSHGRQLKIDWL